MRKDLSIDQLGDLLERPFNATLATYRADGTVLLSPVWHEWRDGGFNVVAAASDIKVRHVQRDPRASMVVADNDPPYRGIEVSGVPTIERDAARAYQTLLRIATRYLGERQGRAYADGATWERVVIRLVPGRQRTWDFSDDVVLSGN